MSVTQNKIDELNATLTVEIAREEYQQDYEKTLNDYRKKANIPGFRPGKAPAALIKKKYGRPVLVEKINEIINKKLNDYIKEQELPVLGNPMPKESDEDVMDWEKPDAFRFTFEIGLAPDFKFKLSKREKYTYHKIVADDEMVNRQIEDYTRRYGKLSEPEESGEKDLLLGDLIELDENGEIKEGGIMHNSNISLEFMEDAGAKEALVGLKPGDNVEVDADAISRDKADKAKMLGITESELAEHSNRYKFNVKEVKRMIPAELNQELFDKVLGEGKADSEEAFRTQVKENLEAQFVGQSDQLFKKQLVEKMLEKTKIELPDDFLKRWIRQANENPISEEQLEKDYPNYADNLRWQLVENRIVEENDLNISSEELRNHASEYVRSQYAQYGLQPGDAEIQSHVDHLLRSQKDAQQLAEGLVQQKVLSFIKDNVKLVDKEVSYSEFLELMYEGSNN